MDSHLHFHVYIQYFVCQLTDPYQTWMDGAYIIIGYFLRVNSSVASRDFMLSAGPFKISLVNRVDPDQTAPLGAV